MEAGTSCSTRIDMEKPVFFVRDHLEYMGVACDKQTGRVCAYGRPDPAVVMARVSSDVGHPDIQPFPELTLVSRETGTDETPVNISVNRHHGSNPVQLEDHILITNVTGVPDLITLPEIVRDSGVEEPMGI